MTFILPYQDAALSDWYEEQLFALGTDGEQLPLNMIAIYEKVLFDYTALMKQRVLAAFRDSFDWQTGMTPPTVLCPCESCDPLVGETAQLSIQ